MAVGEWATEFVQPLTPERFNLVKQQTLSRKFFQFNWSKLPLETLERIDKILDSFSLDKS